MTRLLLFSWLVFSLIGCGGDESDSKSNDEADSNTSNSSPDSFSFESRAGKTFFSFYFPRLCIINLPWCRWKRSNSGLVHDDDGNPVTNLSTSKRNLASWTSWIRTGAKSPMPTFFSDEYSDVDLSADYKFLTGRTE